MIAVGETPNGRSLFLGPPHAAAPYTVFIGSGGMSSMDKVYGLLPDAGGSSATSTIIAEGLSHPNGVAADWTACTTDAQCGGSPGATCDVANRICDDAVFYVAEYSRVLKWPLAEAMAALDGSGGKLVVKEPENVFVSDIPTADGGHHAWKFLAVGPDRALYVPVGSPCNICVTDSYGNPIDDKSVFGSILKVPPGGGTYSEAWKYAYGIRNTVGFDWHPVTQELFFTDNGADWMGDDIPPDEVRMQAILPAVMFPGAFSERLAVVTAQPRDNTRHSRRSRSALWLSVVLWSRERALPWLHRRHTRRGHGLCPDLHARGCEPARARCRPRDALLRRARHRPASDRPHGLHHRTVRGGATTRHGESDPGRRAWLLEPAAALWLSGAEGRPGRSDRSGSVHCHRCDFHLKMMTFV